MKICIKKLKDSIKYICVNPYVFCLLLGFMLNCGVELLSRKSVVSVVSYLTDRPVIFLYNSLAIALTVSFALLTRRRVFGFALLSIMWLVTGVANSILLVFRTTPFTAADLLVIESALAVLDSYMSAMQIALLGIGVILLLILIAVVFKKAPKRKEPISYRNVICYIGGLFLAVYFSTLAGMESGVLASRFGNIGAAYMEYGFPYCFGNSLFNTGITRPADYSEQIVDELIAAVEKPIEHSSYPIVEKEQTEQEKPNIIFLQLESFFDPSRIKGVEFSENPLPNFTRLKKDYTSGYLSVPSVGAGTVNTEFEIITGMNLDFFGPGEYPYKTVLKETTCESIAYNLREEGYKSHVIHNNDGTFYERNVVLPQLGFDSFTSLEYMMPDEFTYAGWAKDKVLIPEIRKSLRSTKEQDVIYAISVQGHGSYPTEEMENPAVKVAGFRENNSFEYYVNQLYEMDAFIGDLIQMLQEYPERVILVMYGDHLPGFELSEEELTNGDIYQTEYVIWDNCSLAKKDKNLESYQLSAYVMEQAGFHNGILTKYHQSFAGESNYLEGLELLQYDILYGDREVYDGENPYEPTQMVMGTEKITVNKVSAEEKLCRVQGGNFTPYSHVAINGKFADTEYVNRYTLVIREKLEDGDIITVHQAGKDSVSLSQTKEYVYHVN
ncbi:MAG: LTA synthase family protein [Lachnospiraceae bacterium]|nr:LTA synthase family protein [Lachnospiraceae bacterium]